MVGRRRTDADRARRDDDATPVAKSSGLGRVHTLIARVATEHASTARLSAAVALGTFIGCTPFLGIHTLAAIPIARVSRLNVLAVVFGTQISMPLTAAIPIAASIHVGHWLKTGERLALGWRDFDLTTAEHFFTAWLYGSPFVGAAFALAAYVATAIVLTVVRRGTRADTGTRNSPQRWSGRSKGSGAGYAFYLYAFRLLGRRGGYALLPLITSYYFLFARDARRHSNDFFRRLYGARTWRERQGDTWRHFNAFARAIADRLLLMAGREDAFSLEHERLDFIHDAHRQSKGVLLLSAHVGGFALAGELLRGVALNIVAYDNEAESIRRFFERHRASNAPRIIVVRDGPSASLEILHALRRGEIVAMLADRIVEGAASLRVPFLGAPADFPTGPFLVAVLSGAPVVLAFSLKEGPSHQHFVAREPRIFGPVARSERSRAIEESVRWYANELETVVRQYPEQWYNFFEFWPQGDTATE